MGKPLLDEETDLAAESPVVGLSGDSNLVAQLGGQSEGDTGIGGLGHDGDCNRPACVCQTLPHTRPVPRASIAA